MLSAMSFRPTPGMALWFCLCFCFPLRPSLNFFANFAVTLLLLPSKALDRKDRKEKAAKIAKKNYFRAAAGCPTPASLASFAALSVASQVKSASLRPKCP